MKKFTLFFFLLCTLCYIKTDAQCSSPSLDSVCYSTLISAGGGICKDSLPQGMVGHPYMEDVSFVMPPSVNITVPLTATVTLYNINITGIGGMPIGLDYACSKASCVYHPSAGDELGALRVCGTPLTPGLYTLTVYILADVNVSGVGDRYGEAQTYTTTLRILPDTSGGAATFSYSPGGVRFCDTTDLTFHATVSSAANPVKYVWNFGNGNTSTAQNPVIQTYDPSILAYKASLKTTLYAYRLKRVRVVSTNTSAWTGDAGELYAGWPYYPDFVFKNTTTNRATAERSDENTPEWTGLTDTIVPGTDSIGFTLTDIDGSFFGLDPDDIVMNSKLPVVLGTVNYISGSNSLQIEYDTIPYTIFNDTVTLHVNPLPAAGVTNISDDSICIGDSVIVHVNYGSGYAFQWQKDGIDIALATDSFIIARSAGVYRVNITDLSSGCSVGSTSSTLNTFNNISVVSIAVVAPGQIANTNYPGTSFVIEWFKDGVLIPGQHGVLLPYSGSGSYTCHIYNPAFPRCGATSSALVVSGIDEISPLSYHLQIYPNPSEGIFNLSFDAFEKDDYKLHVTDMVGECMYSESLENYSGHYSKELDLSYLHKGIYFIRITSKQQTNTLKILLQ